MQGKNDEEEAYKFLVTLPTGSNYNRWKSYCSYF